MTTSASFFPGFFALTGLDRNGVRVYATGRAGAGWVSPDITQAFPYSFERACALSHKYNAISDLHGVTFALPVFTEDID